MTKTFNSINVAHYTKYLTDEKHTLKFDQAIEEVVKPKDVVLNFEEGEEVMNFKTESVTLSTRKTNIHSTGYGLFIAKNIVKEHGGTIRAESDGWRAGARPSSLSFRFQFNR